MMVNKLSALISAIVLVVAAIILPAHAVDPSETLEVWLKAPAGVPVNAELTGHERHVLSQISTEEPHLYTFPRGNYTLTAAPVVWAGKRYTLTTPDLTQVTDDVTTLELTWVLAAGVQDLSVTSLTDTDASFEWTGAQGRDLQLRRNQSEKAPTSLYEGEVIPVGDNGARDTGMNPGTTYAYTLFQDEQPAYSLVLGTSDAEADLSVAFVREYSATFLTATPPWEGHNGNLVLQWPHDVPPPLLGSGIVVPVSEELPGGFVGHVFSLSEDGARVELSPGGYSDVLAFMNMESKDFPPEGEEENPALDPITSQDTPAAPRDEARRQGIPSSQHREHGGRLAPATVEQSNSVPTAKPSALPNTGGDGAPSCWQANSEYSIKMNAPELTARASFKHKLDKYLWRFPTEVQLDTYVTVTAKGRLDASIKTGGSCSLPGLDKITLMFHPGGVPTMLLIEPTVETRFDGSFEAENVNVMATLGFKNHTTFGLGGANTVTSRIAKADAVAPTHSNSGSLSLKIGGALTFGPGMGNKHVGAVAGISGELTVLRADASFTNRAKADGTVTSCASLSASGDASLKLSAKAWAPFISHESSWEILKGTWPYTEPWTFPAGCENAKLSDDVLGDGITKESDTTTGSPQQQGRVEGFVPGEKTWVLSTGRIADAVGHPDFVADTRLGMPGDDELSALAGHPTYDAVTYAVTVIPKGSTLKVRYVFASEEYPEYVGSEFNDIMRITVDGKSCAHVPGTDTPVAVNTINGSTNKEYFIDNRNGRAGYGTSMDGITVPLTCAVPVMPGEPTQVVIKLADTSDEILDSAVALLDRGIWSE